MTRFNTFLVMTLTALAPVGAVAQNGKPEQISVSAKIIEYQTTKDVETGLSAYFRKRVEFGQYGEVITGNDAVTSADLTFPSSRQGGLTVFLDRIRFSDGDIEVILQALVDENRASILSHPKIMVKVGAPNESIIKTVNRTPYQKPTVVQNTPITVTDFRETGVTLKIKAEEIADDDGDWSTTEDTYIKLNVHAEVLEEGQRISVALSDQFVAQADTNAILVPEFVSRSVTTSVWVRHGDVLILGGLFRNTKSKDLSTLPWLAQGEDILVATAERFIPGNFLSSPISANLGNRSTSEGRRELVFMLKADVYTFTMGDEHGFARPGEDKSQLKLPREVITEIVEGLREAPKGIVEGISGVGQGDSVRSELGGK